jgi:hypothetical protein
MLFTIALHGIPLGGVDRLSGGTFGIPRPDALRVVAQLEEPRSSACSALRESGPLVDAEICEEMVVLGEFGEQLPAHVVRFAFTDRSGSDGATLVIDIDAAHAIVAALLPLLGRSGGGWRPEA